MAESERLLACSLTMLLTCVALHQNSHVHWLSFSSRRESGQEMLELLVEVEVDWTSGLNIYLCDEAAKEVVQSEACRVPALVLLLSVLALL